MRICCSCGKRFEGESWRCPVCRYEPDKVDGYVAFAPQMAEETEGFHSSYFATLADLEPNSFWFRSRNRLLLWALKRYFPDARNFFEIGCGTGYVLAGIRQELTGIRLIGSEVFTAGLAFAEKRLPGVNLFQMDARQIPFEDEFDVMGAFDVLEHIANDELVLTQMYRAVRKGGGVLLTVPQHPFLWSKVDEYSKHVRRYKAAELERKVDHAGFDILRRTSFVSLLLPLMLASRLRLRSSDKALQAAAEFRLSPLTNIFLKRVMDLERAMISSGISLPCGGSLLVVARKPETPP